MNARSHLEWTDNQLCRPFTLFLLTDKSGMNQTLLYHSLQNRKQGRRIHVSPQWSIK